MATEIWLCPFERRIVGNRGTVLLRRNLQHEAECATAIRRRKHPAWSQFNCGFRVEEGAAA